MPPVTIGRLLPPAFVTVTDEIPFRGKAGITIKPLTQVQSLVVTGTGRRISKHVPEAFLIQNASC